MRAMTFFATMLVGLGLWAGAARAAVNIEVDLSSQTMHVATGSGETRDWPVSTARFGYVTPRGHYGVQSLQAMHYSRKYHNSPMPHSIFFHGGYAIHGTYETAALGRAASHGCVRLSPSHAAELYGMVEAEGASISIVGSAPQSDHRYAARRHSERVQVASAHHRRHDRDYARAPAADAPLAYAPARLAPTFSDWFSNPIQASDY